MQADSRCSTQTHHKCSTFISTVYKKSLIRHGLGSEADHLNIMSRSLLIPMLPNTDFNPSPTDPTTSAEHPGTT